MARRTLRVNCNLRLLLLTCLVLCYQDQVQTADQRITSRCTATTDALMGDPATITCYFNIDLKEHSKSFNVYRYGIDKREEILLKCFWPAFGQTECDLIADGYEFDGIVSDRLNITIPITSIDNIGKFTCNPEPSYPGDIEECYLMLKQRPESTTAVPSAVSTAGQNSADDLEEEGEGSSNTGGIVGGVLVFLVVVAAVIALVCRKRVLKLIPWCGKNPDKVEGQKDIESGDQLNDTGQPLLGTSSKETEADHPGPSDITVGTVDENEGTVKNERDGTKETDKECNDSGYGAGTLKHQNLAPFVESVTGSRDLHSDIPVSEGREEDTSFTSHRVANGQDENSKTLPSTEGAGHIVEMEMEKMNRSTLSTDTRDETQQNVAERSGGDTTQTAAAGNAQCVVADPGEMLQTAATANEREPQKTAPVPNRETNVHNVGRSTPRDEEPPALREIKGSTGGELTGAAGNTQDQARRPTENDRWGQTAEEAGNQRRGTHVPVIGDALKPVQKTKRDEEHVTEMPQEFRWAPATQNTSSDSDRKPNQNVLFYRNQIKCQPDGAYIEEIHREWSKNLDILEEHHTYIQWLFPTGEKPGNNKHAQQLWDHEAKAIREDPVTFKRFMKSYKMMLHFYGLELADPVTGDVRRMQYGWQDRYDNLVKNTHNFLRITRILTCLGEMGLEHYKAPFIHHMLLEAMQGNLLKTLDSCGRFWIQTVVDDTQKQELLDLYMSVTSTSVMFSGHR